MSIPRKRVISVLQQHGINKPPDGMIRELADFMERNSIINDAHVNEIIGRHARSRLKAQQISNQSTGAVNSATIAPIETQPVITEKEMEKRDLKQYHINMISNAILLKNNDNLPEALRILGTIPDNSTVVKQRDKEIDAIEKLMDKKLEESEAEKKEDNLPAEHNAIIDIAVKLRNAGDYEGALEKLIEVPDDSPVVQRRDDNIDQIQVDMKNLADADVKP